MGIIATEQHLNVKRASQATLTRWRLAHRASFWTGFALTHPRESDPASSSTLHSASL